MNFIHVEEKWTFMMMLAIILTMMLHMMLTIMLGMSFVTFNFPFFFYCVFCFCCKCKPNILLILCWLVGHFTLSHDLRGTIIKVMVALCFLAPISNKFVEFVLDL